MRISSPQPHMPIDLQPSPGQHPEPDDDETDGDQRRKSTTEQSLVRSPLVAVQGVTGRTCRRSVIRLAEHQPLRAATAFVSSGAMVNRSPTTPRSAMSKIGASPSLLTATIVFEVCMPARC